MTEDEFKDLEETRRCIYMAAIAIRDKDETVGPELTATVCNALLHHSPILGPEKRHVVTQWLIHGDEPDAPFLFDVANDITDVLIAGAFGAS